MAATGGLRVSQEDLGDAVMLSLEGEIDAANVTLLREALERAASKEAPRLVVDVRRVSYIDSLGFTALTQAVKTAREHRGRMAVLCDDRLANLFGALGLGEDLAVSRTPGEAVKRAATIQYDISAFADIDQTRAAVRAARELIEQGALPPDDEELTLLRDALARYEDSL